MCCTMGSVALNTHQCDAKQKIVFDNIKNKKLNMVVGDSCQVKLNKKKLGKRTKVIYVSSNKKVATVNKKGRIKAKRSGKIKIIVRIEDTDVKKTIRLKVRKPVRAKKIRIMTMEKYLFVDDSLLLSTKVSPTRKLDEELVWSSSNESVAVVNDLGEVQGISPGKVTIKVKTNKSHKLAKKKITVRRNEVKSVHFSSSKAVVGLGQTQQLAIAVTPNYVTDRAIAYTSSNTSVAVVDQNGRVTGKKTGNVIIKAVYRKNQSIAAQCTVSVSKVKGMLTKQMLDKLNLSAVKNLMIVAHPDDDSIFGGAHLISDRYLVVCITNGKTYRKEEFETAMNISNSERIMLSYPDTHNEGKKIVRDADYKWDECQLAIQSDIKLLLNYKKWDTIVTHNPEGEYGHIHHKNLNKYTTAIYNKSPNSAKRLMYFAKFYKKNQLIDKIKNTLPEINPELFSIKIKMLEAYKSKKYTCFTWLWHMQPYENWVYSEDWKKKV